MLWRQSSTGLESEFLDLPTWSWAASGGEKFWCPYRYAGAFRYLPKVLGISELGYLATAGHITDPMMSLRRTSDAELGPLPLLDPETSIIPRIWDYDASISVYLARDDSSAQHIMGIVVFDKGDPIHNARCVLIASTQRDRYIDPRRRDAWLKDSLFKPRQRETEYWHCHDEYDLQRYHAEQDEADARADALPRNLGTAGGKDSNSRPQSATTSSVVASQGFLPQVSGCDLFTFVRDSTTQNINPTITAQLTHLQDTTKFVYWALIVEPVGEAKFKRVGLAMLYPQAFKRLKAEFAEFEIV